MVFVFDLDDTLCDTDAYSEKYIKKFIKKYNLPYKQIAKETRYAEMKFNWEELIAKKWYKHYGDYMMLNFPLKENVSSILNELYEAGHKIVIATARDKEWHAKPKDITIAWLKKNNIRYHKLYVGRKDKESICEIENADVFVDDDIKIVSAVQEFFAKKGKGKAFLSNTIYNKTIEAKGLDRVNSLQEIVDKTLNNFNLEK